MNVGLLAQLYEIGQHLVSLVCSKTKIHSSKSKSKIDVAIPTSTTCNSNLKMVLDHYRSAQNKNIEQILFENEPHVLLFRDKIYSEAKNNGITSKSNDDQRVKILQKVIEYTYMNIEPPNEYTKQTDRKHWKEVAQFAAMFAKKQKHKVPITLICASWCHDIERFIPSTKCKYLPEDVDKYRKQVIHPTMSAKIAMVLFKNGPISMDELERIYELIIRHDLPNPQEDLYILDELLIPKVSDDLIWELECLMDADAYAFFESTISFFIMFKSKTNSPSWIWERVINNIRRLRPHLRTEAVKCVKNLSHELLSKMDVKYNELNRFDCKL